MFCARKSCTLQTLRGASSIIVSKERRGSHAWCEKKRQIRGEGNLKIAARLALARSHESLRLTNKLTVNPTLLSPSHYSMASPNASIICCMPSLLLQPKLCGIPLQWHDTFVILFTHKPKAHHTLLTRNTQHSTSQFLLCANSVPR